MVSNPSRRMPQPAQLQRGLQIALFATLGLSWAALIILFISMCAISTDPWWNTITTLIPTQAELTWVCVVGWFLVLVYATTMLGLSFKSSVSRTHFVSISSRGLLFFTAIIVSWLGVACNTLVATTDNDRGNRLSSVLTGQLLVLGSAVALAIVLLFMDNAATASNTSTTTPVRSVKCLPRAVHAAVACSALWHTRACLA